MSEVQDIITSRRSIYRFEESPVEMASLKLPSRLLGAPCHKQTHPWNSMFSERTLVALPFRKEIEG